MSTLAPIKITIAGIDKFSATYDKAFKKLNKAGRNISSVGKKMSLGLSLPILGAGLAVVKTAATFEQGLNKVEALTRASTEDMIKMRQVAQDLGAKTKFSATEAAEGMAFLGMAGYNTNQILSDTPKVLTLAAATGAELGRSADILSNIMGAFELEAKDTTKTVDILAAITSSANVDLEMVSETMKMAAPIAKQFGASLKSTAVITGFLGNIGIQGTNAATALKNIFTVLAAPPKAAAQWFDHLNVKTKDAVGNPRQVAEVFGDLGKKLNKLPKATRLQAIKDIFGKIPIAAAAALSSDLGKTNSQFLKLAENMKDVTGRAAQMEETMNKGAVGAFNQAKAALEAFSIALSDSGLLDLVTKALLKVASVFRTIAEFSKPLLKTIVVFAGLAVAAGPFLLIVGNLIIVFSALFAKISAAGGVIALLSNPIGWVVAGVVALTAGVVYFGVKFRSVFAKITPFVKLLGIQLGKAFGALAEGPVGMSLKWLFDMLSKLGGVIKSVASGALGFLGKAAGVLFSDEDLKASGFSAEDVGRKSFAGSVNDDIINNFNSANKKSKSEVTIKLEGAPPGTTIKGKKGVDDIIIENGPLLGGAF